MEKNQFRTQKAKGLLQLSKLELGVVPRFTVISEPEEIKEKAEVMFAAFGKVFARPCPKFPRHGFVESRVCASIDEVLGVWREAREADQEAELILMPPINAKASAIYTPTSLALGPGHDGATGGIGSIGLMLSEGKLPASTTVEAGIKDWPYIEVVYGNISSDNKSQVVPYIVQLRDGPKVIATDKLIPDTMTVERIVVLSEDPDERPSELAWEVQAKEFLPGTVVYHPGGTLMSHYAVHAVLNKAAVYLKDPPKVGDTIFPGDHPPKLDPFAARAGMEIGLKIQDINYQDALSVGLFSLHEFLFNQNSYGSKLIGAGASLVLRLSTAACLGELRHIKRKSFKRTGPLEGTSSDSEFRSIIHKRSWQDAVGAQKYMSIAIKEFFEGQWGSGFGGAAWGACAYHCIKLWDSMVAFYRKPTADSLAAVAGMLNNVINTAHNNGWQFNKFTNDARLMDRAATSHPRFIVQTGYPVFRILQEVRPDVTDLERGRKTRALTELANRMAKNGRDLEAIVAEKSAKAEQKLKGSDEEGCGCNHCTYGSDDSDDSDDSGPEPIKVKDLGKLILAQMSILPDGDLMHFQFKTENMPPGWNYLSGNLPVTKLAIKEIYHARGKVDSWSPSGEKKYVSLSWMNDKVWCDHVVICTVEEMLACTSQFPVTTEED